MIIKSLSFCREDTGLRLDNITFSSHFTLLLGISGCGKTTIVRTIMQLLGMMLNKRQAEYPCSGKLCFSVDDKEYTWMFTVSSIEGEYQYTDETLMHNNYILAKRSTDKVGILNGESLASPLSVEASISVVSMFKFDFKTCLKGIEMTMLSFGTIYAQGVEKFDEEYKAISKHRIGQNVSLLARLQYIHNDDVLGERFMNYVWDIFPDIEDVYTLQEDDKIVLAIRTNGKTISGASISSGMIKVFNYLALAMTTPANSVLLLDEFETSLGMNCLDQLLQILIDETRDNIQVIITSHHPLILNTVDLAEWRIVTRTADTITTHTSTEYKITKSSFGNYHELCRRFIDEGVI